jgi:hypothetical protein
LVINIDSPIRAGVVEWQTRRNQNVSFSGKAVLAANSKLHICICEISRYWHGPFINMEEKLNGKDAQKIDGTQIRRL